MATKRRVLCWILLCALLLSACESRITYRSRQGTFRPIPNASVESGVSTAVEVTDSGDEVEEVEPPEDAPFAWDPPEVDITSLCYGEEGTDTSVVDAVNTTLLTLPRWIRGAFLDSGWSMCVVPYDIATSDYGEQYKEGLVYGSTSYKHGIIKIQNDLRAAANAPIHELGHWLDSQLGYPTLYSEEFLQIFDDEGELYRSGFSPTCNWDAQEFLAEGFWCYWKSPRLLQKTCPSLHSFIESCLDTLEGQYNTEQMR